MMVLVEGVTLRTNERRMTSFSFIGEGECATAGGEFPSIEANRTSEECRDDCRLIGEVCKGYSHVEGECNLYGGWGSQNMMLKTAHDFGIWSYVKNHKENGSLGPITTVVPKQSTFCFASQQSLIDTNCTFKVSTSSSYLQLSHSSGVSLALGDLPKISQTLLLTTTQGGYQISSSDSKIYLCLETGRFSTTNASDPCTFLFIEWKGVVASDSANQFFISLQGSSPRKFLSIDSSGNMIVTDTNNIISWSVPPSDDCLFQSVGSGFCSDTKNDNFPGIDLSIITMDECESACKAIAGLCVGYYIQSRDVPATATIAMPTITTTKILTSTRTTSQTRTLSGSHTLSQTYTESHTATLPSSTVVPTATKTESLIQVTATETPTFTSTITLTETPSLTAGSPTASLSSSRTLSMTANLSPSLTIIPTAAPTAAPTTQSPNQPINEYCRVYHFGIDGNKILMEYALEGYPFIGVNNLRSVPSSPIVSSAGDNGKCYSKSEFFSATSGYHTLGDRLTGGCGHTKPISWYVVLEGNRTCEQICTQSGSLCLAFNVNQHECFIYTAPWISSSPLLKHFLPEAILRSNVANSSTVVATAVDSWTVRSGNTSVCYVKDDIFNIQLTDCRYDLMFNSTAYLTLANDVSLLPHDDVALHTQSIQITVNPLSTQSNPKYQIRVHNASGDYFLSHSCGSSTSGGVVVSQDEKCSQWGILKQNDSAILFIDINSTALYLNDELQLTNEFDTRKSLWTIRIVENSCRYSVIGVGSCSDSRGFSYAMAVMRHVSDMSTCQKACKSSSEYCIAFQYDSLIQQCYIHGGHNGTLLVQTLQTAGYTAIAAGNGQVNSFGPAVTGMPSPGPAHVECYAARSRKLPVVSIPMKPTGEKSFPDILVSNVNETTTGGLSLSKINNALIFTWIHNLQLSVRKISIDLNDSLILENPFNINFDVSATSEMSCSGNPLTDLVLCVWEYQNNINCVVVDPNTRTADSCRDTIGLQTNRNVSSPKASPLRSGWIVVWESRSDSSPSDSTVAYELLSRLGEVNGTVTEYTNAESPNVCSFGTSNFLLAWKSPRGIVSHYSASNSVIVTNNVLAKRPVVACGYSSYVVLWELGNIHNDTTSVFARTYAATTPLHDEVIVSLDAWDPTAVFQDGANKFSFSYMTADSSGDSIFSMRNYRNVSETGEISPPEAVQNQFFRFNTNPPAVSSSYGSGVIENTVVGYVYQEGVFFQTFAEEQPNETQSPATPIPQSTEIPTEIPVSNGTDLPETALPDDSPQECQCADRWTSTGVTYYGCQNILSDGSSYCKLDQACANGNTSLFECPVTSCSCADSWVHNNRPYSGCSVTEDLPALAWCFVNASCPDALEGRESPWIVCGKSNRVIPTTSVPSTPIPIITPVPSTAAPKPPSDDSFPAWGWVLVNAGGLLVISTLCYCAITKREAHNRHQTLAAVPTATVLIDNMSVAESEFTGSQHELKELDWDGNPYRSPYDCSNGEQKVCYYLVFNHHKEI